MMEYKDFVLQKGLAPCLLPTALIKRVYCLLKGSICSISHCGFRQKSVFIKHARWNPSHYMLHIQRNTQYHPRMKSQEHPIAPWSKQISPIRVPWHLSATLDPSKTCFLTLECHTKSAESLKKRARVPRAMDSHGLKRDRMTISWMLATAMACSSNHVGKGRNWLSLHTPWNLVKAIAVDSLE